MKKALLLLLFTFIPIISFAEEIIVDNSDTGFSINSGSWVNSTSVSGFNGVDYLHDGNAQGGSDVSWDITVSSPASPYEVYARWTSDTNRTSVATYTIDHSGGSTDITVNQKVNGGTWVLLGNFTNPTAVSLSNTGADGFVIADAVRAVGGPDVTPPAPGPVNFGPAVGSDMWTTYAAQLGLFVLHTNNCDEVTEAFIEVGASGLGMCMEKAERPALTWEEARESCATAQKRLPEPGEWKVSCRQATALGLSNMTNGLEWTSNFATSITAEGIFGLQSSVNGDGGCFHGTFGWVARRSPSPFEALYAYRCVR